jgi:hypothetical protein
MLTDKRQNRPVGMAGCNRERGDISGGPARVQAALTVSVLQASINDTWPGKTTRLQIAEKFGAAGIADTDVLLHSDADLNAKIIASKKITPVRVPSTLRSASPFPLRGRVHSRRISNGPASPLQRPRRVLKLDT